jgi:hypothetical protein
MSVGLVSIGDFCRLQQTFAWFPAPELPAVSAGIPAKRLLQQHARIKPEISVSDLPENPFKVNGRLLKTAANQSAIGQLRPPCRGNSFYWV